MKSFPRTRNRYRAFRWGIYYKHPLCCVLRYAFDRFDYHGLRRGGKVTEKAGMFVPCGVFHKCDEDFSGEVDPERSRIKMYYLIERKFTSDRAKPEKDQVEGAHG